jgi:hypothetical protein
MIDSDALRRLVREVIETELAAARRGTAPGSESVRIASDADLAAFAQRVLILAEDPGVRQAIVAGRHPFRLDTPATTHHAAPNGDVTRIDKGVVTEAALARLPRGAVRLVVGDGVTVTPLAKDRARRLGITIERSKP